MVGIFASRNGVSVTCQSGSFLRKVTIFRGSPSCSVYHAALVLSVLIIEASAVTLGD